MFKCGEGHVFEKPIALLKDYFDRGEVMYGCPICGDGFEKAYQCRMCDEWFYGDEINKDICYECAKKEYTHRKGILFINRHKEFYLWLYDIQDYYLEFVKKKYKKNGLIKVLERDFLQRIDLDEQSDDLVALQDFCMDNIDEWIDFLVEEI